MVSVRVWARAMVNVRVRIRIKGVRGKGQVSD